MKSIRLCLIFLAILTMIAFLGNMVHAEFHHAEDCTVCHFRQCNDCSNRMFVNCEITTPPPNSEDKGVILTATTGDNSYADGDSVYDGVCEVCHIQTLYHTNTGSGAPHYDGLNCVPCHRHPDSSGEGDFFFPQVIGPQSHNTHFQHDRGPHLSSCTDCHHPDDFTLFADGEPLAPTTVCDPCHSPGGAYNGSEMAKEYWADGIY